MVSRATNGKPCAYRFTIFANTQNKHHQVDDYAYGVLPAWCCKRNQFTRIQELISKSFAPVVYLLPRQVVDQIILQYYSRVLWVSCGHYKELDQRLRDVCDEIFGRLRSSGGEIPAMAFIGVAASTWKSLYRFSPS